MPKSVVMISRAPLHLPELVELYRNVGMPMLGDGDRLIVETDSGYFAIEPQPSMAAEYDEDELASITSRIESPSYSLIEFRTNADLERALSQMVEMPDALVDDDHGIILPVAQFHSRLSEGTLL